MLCCWVFHFDSSSGGWASVKPKPRAKLHFFFGPSRIELPQTKRYSPTINDREEWLMIPMPTIIPYPFDSLIRWQLLSNSIQNKMNTAAISNKLFKWKPFGSNLDGSSRHLSRFHVVYTQFSFVVHVGHTQMWDLNRKYSVMYLQQNQCFIHWVFYSSHLLRWFSWVISMETGI